MQVVNISNVNKQNDIVFGEKLRKTNNETVNNKTRPLTYCAKTLTKETLEELLSQGKNRTEIAKKLNVSTQSVNKYLKIFGLYRCAKIAKFGSKEKETMLRNMANKGLSLHAMADASGISVRNIRKGLDQFNIHTDAQEEFRILQKYFTATNENDKTKAFVEIDKCLEEIAKQRFQQTQNGTYEDNLQDTRLKFLEKVEESKKRNVTFPCAILRDTRNEMLTIVPNEIQTISLETLRDIPNISVNDEQIEKFESQDFNNRTWNFLQSILREKDYQILEQHIRKNKSISEIAKLFKMPEKSLKICIYKILSIRIPKQIARVKSLH